MNAFLTWVRARAPEWATTVKDWLGRAISAIWASLVALVKSPAVWLACGVVFVGGFCLGHSERSVAVRKVSAVNVGLSDALATERAKTQRLAGDLAKAQRDLKAALDALPAPVAEPAPTPPQRKPAPAKRTPVKG